MSLVVYSALSWDCPTTQAAVRDVRGRDIGAVDAVPTRCRLHLLRGVVGSADRTALLHTRMARWRIDAMSATEETCPWVSFCLLGRGPSLPALAANTRAADALHHLARVTRRRMPLRTPRSHNLVVRTEAQGTRRGSCCLSQLLAPSVIGDVGHDWRVQVEPQGRWMQRKSKFQLSKQFWLLPRAKR